MKKNKKAIPYGIDQMPWWRSRRLACGIKAISFPYDGWVRLDFPEGHCCDMYRAIGVAESIAKEVLDWVEVRAVTTFSGGCEDTVYLKRDDNSWVARA